MKIYDYCLIYLTETFDMQEIHITDESEAAETAERLKFFFQKQGIKIHVNIYGVIEGKAQFNSAQEFTHCLDDIHEEIYK
jgi:alcohol dehydrogenase YqhD (iron-dependent ADH family)